MPRCPHSPASCCWAALLACIRFKPVHALTSAPAGLRSLGSQQQQHTTADASAASASGASAAPAPAPHARILDGRAVAAAWQEELARDVCDVYAKGGRPPGLGVVLVGSRPDSLLYVTRKREACERVGGWEAYQRGSWHGIRLEAAVHAAGSSGGSGRG
jgi:hypothetical protein